MTTSNSSWVTGSARRANTTKETRATVKRKRLLITDFFYLKAVLARRKFEANPFTQFPVQQRPGDRRHPAHPVVVRVGLIHANDPIRRFFAARFADRHARSEADDVRRPSLWIDDL